MSVIITVIAAFASIVAIARWRDQSAYALGKVSAVISTTAVIADAWKQVNVISKRLHDHPTGTSLPVIDSTEERREVAVPRKSELDEFFDEHPSVVPRFRTGGIRGYSAYDPPRG